MLVTVTLAINLITFFIYQSFVVFIWKILGTLSNLKENQ